MNASKFLAVACALSGLYLATVWDKASTPSAPLSELTTIRLGGQLHYATLRSRLDDGALASAPVLLMLHGGPGASSLPHIHHTDFLLEEHFIVVNYDQRSTGKSCRFHNFSTSTLSIQQHAEDAIEMVEYLRRRFKREKIYMIGGSWGSKLALLLARDYPHLFHHVGVRGLAADTEKSERLSKAFVQAKFADFEVNGPPYGSRVKDLTKQRHWLYRAGGMTAGCIEKKCSKYELTIAIAKTVIRSPEMSWADIVRFRRCYMQTLEQMWPEVERFNVTKEVPRLDVPLLILHGRLDYCTVHTLVQTYVKSMEAPRKRLVWFDKSGHSPESEEAIKFSSVVIEEFLGKGGKER